MFDNDGLAVNIIAPEGGLVAGQYYYDPTSGFAGAVLGTVAEGEAVAMEIARGHRFNLLSSLNIVAGDILHVQDDGSLDRTADGGTARAFMKVTEVVAGVTDTEDQVIGVLLPQTWAKFVEES